MTPRFIARQLSRPTGLFGHIMGRIMNRHNARMNAFALEHLEPHPCDRILEIGFGGGVNLPPLIKIASFVAGIDPSRDVVRHASSRFRAAVISGRAVFRTGRVEAIPFERACFRKVCTVNTVYFWKSLESGFREIHRVLAPGGRLVMGFLPKQWMARLDMPDDIFTLRDPEEVTAALTGVGFTAVRLERPRPETLWNVMVATR
jgi:arsenite methyltransferase